MPRLLPSMRDANFFVRADIIWLIIWVCISQYWYYVFCSYHTILSLALLMWNLGMSSKPPILCLEHTPTRTGLAVAFETTPRPGPRSKPPTQWSSLCLRPTSGSCLVPCHAACRMCIYPNCGSMYHLYTKIYTFYKVHGGSWDLVPVLDRRNSCGRYLCWLRCGCH